MTPEQFQKDHATVCAWMGMEPPMENLPAPTLDWLHEVGKKMRQEGKLSEYHQNLYNICIGLSDTIEADIEDRIAASAATICPVTQD